LFFENFGFLFLELERFLNITISATQRNYIEEEFSTENARKKAAAFADFDSYDPASHIHGKHVYTGQTGTWKELVAEEEWNKVNQYLHKVLKQWDYI